MKVSTLSRRTVTDELFEHLHDEILSLRLLPGVKMSEVEIAERFGTSRQPVRDAFNRLANIDLLLVRPQRATVVCGFSISKIAEARFLRLAIELEVVRRACDVWDEKRSQKIQASLNKQQAMIGSGRYSDFHKLDSDFHLLICELSGCYHGIDAIKNCKRDTDRLCMLSFNNEDQEVEMVFDEHCQLLLALENHDAGSATTIIRRHFRRLDSIIENIHSAYPAYFE